MTSEESKGHRWSLMSDPIIGFAIFFFFLTAKPLNQTNAEVKERICGTKWVTALVETKLLS